MGAEAEVGAVKAVAVQVRVLNENAIVIVDRIVFADGVIFVSVPVDALFNSFCE